MHTTAWGSLQEWLKRGSMLLALISLPAWAAPQQLTLKYDLQQQGATIGTVRDRVLVTGNRYQLESTTEGKGIYRLMGERTLSSQGLVVANALRPGHFESLQSNHPHKTIINDFDWVQKKLTLDVKGERETLSLPKGTQDLLSVMYCWMWQPPKGPRAMVPVTNGKKLSQRQFVVTEEKTPLQTAAGSFRVIKLADSDGEKILYLARDKGYLPVKLVVIDGNKRMEQVLASMTGQ